MLGALERFEQPRRAHAGLRSFRIRRPVALAG
jgi:hypothetical protein